HGRHHRPAAQGELSRLPRPARGLRPARHCLHCVRRASAGPGPRLHVPARRDLCGRPRRKRRRPTRGCVPRGGHPAVRPLPADVPRREHRHACAREL
ncbi:hypothetical protein H4R21_007038, partial [Coemansia helicoidea]